MIPSVVLDGKPSLWVIEIGPAEEPAMRVQQIPLNLGPRQAGLQQKPPQSTLHRRFSAFGQRAERMDTTCFDLVHETQSDRLVEHDQRLHVSGEPANIEESSTHTCRSQPAYSDNFTGRDLHVSNAQSAPVAHPAGGRNDYFDGIDRINIDPIEPRRGLAGKATHPPAVGRQRASSVDPRAGRTSSTGLDQGGAMPCPAAPWG